MRTTDSTRSWPGRRHALAGVLAAGALAMAAPSAWAEKYKFTDLGNLGGRSSQGMAINTAGRIAGSAEADDFLSHAVVWKGKRAVALDPRHHHISVAYALNDADAVVGMRWVDAWVDFRATLWQDGRTVELGGLGGKRSEAHGINECGDIVGLAYDAAQSNRPVRWRDAVAEDLGTLGGSSGYAQDIDNQGRIVGGSQTTGDVDVHATLWSNGSIVDLGTLRGGLGYSAAVAINDQGVIVGGGEWKNNRSHAIMWKDGAVIDLGTLAGHGESFALDINNAGTVVGWSELPNNAAGQAPEQLRRSHATVWRDGVAIDLNEWLNSETRRDWVLTSARAINDEGVITGVAARRRVIGSSRHAFRLTPVNAAAAPRATRGCGAGR